MTLLHESTLPLSIKLGEIDTVPKAFKYTVSSLQIANGATVSAIVTTATQESTLPLLSVTINHTSLGPMSAQVNDVIEEESTTGLQLVLSELAPSISDATIVALPDPSKLTVMA